MRARFKETQHEAGPNDDRTWGEFNSKPDTHWHYTMVNHVQGGDVVILLAQNKEYLQETNHQHRMSSISGSQDSGQTSNQQGPSSACFLTVACLADSLSLMMEAIGFCETSVNLYQNTHHYITDDSSCHNLHVNY
jgi:hypothetical protein